MRRVGSTLVTYRGVGTNGSIEDSHPPWKLKACRELGDGNAESLRPGVQGTSYPGDSVRKALNPAGVASGRGSFDSTPLGLAPFGENPR
jgi:hypothetical protein